MIKKKEGTNQFELFRNKLENLLDLQHSLCQLSALINWKKFETEFSGFYCADNGRPGYSIRLMVSLEYIEQKEGQSDEEVVKKWLENPYWQYSIGEEYFQIKFPIPQSQVKLHS